MYTVQCTRVPFGCVEMQVGEGTSSSKGAKLKKLGIFKERRGGRMLGFYDSQVAASRFLLQLNRRPTQLRPLNTIVSLFRNMIREEWRRMEKYNRYADKDENAKVVSSHWIGCVAGL